ncbi:MAG: metallophosphoesterase family protein [Geminicoccaceae bacterium]
MHVFRSDWEPAPRAAPPGATLLAIGDVHGCPAQLDAMLAVLAEVVDDARRRGRRAELVMLGDYVDRGPDSPGVLRRLPDIGRRLEPEVPVHLLLGNHDELLLDRLGEPPDPAALGHWLRRGGSRLPGMTPAPDLVAPPTDEEQPDLATLAALLSGLASHRVIGDYVFAHAGIAPDRPLAAQTLDDLLWIREPFLDATDWPHGFAVVHGHTPQGPEVLPHRVGVDSGCFFTGVLTAVQIEDRRLRFHAVSADPEPLEFRELIEASGQRRRFSGPTPLPGS